MDDAVESREKSRCMWLSNALRSCYKAAHVRQLRAHSGALPEEGTAATDCGSELHPFGIMVKAELLSIFNESFFKGVVPEIKKEAIILPLKKAGRPPAIDHLPHILRCQDNGESGAQPSVQPGRNKKRSF